MKKSIFALATLLIVAACSTKEGNFNLSGSIKGLKKGTLYLQRIQDTSLVNIDSLKINGNPDFSFTTNLEEPEMLILHLKKDDGNEFNDRVRFFAEKGQMTIHTRLDEFERDAQIRGSKNQTKLEDFKKMNRKFNNRNLDLIQASFNAQASKNEKAIQAYDDTLKRLIKTKYRYTGNFAAMHKNMEIAPFIIINQIPDANTDYLDTIYKRFPKNIKTSLYGKQLKNMIDKRRTKK